MIFLIVLGGISLYVATHFNLAGKATEEQLIDRLSRKLNAKVEVEQVEITWLNQVALNDLVVFDQRDDTLFHARRVMIGYELVPLIRQKLVLNTIQLIDFGLYIRKDSIGATPNYEFLIEALAPLQADNQRHFINDASLHALFLRRGTVTYDIWDQPRNEEAGLPDPNHLCFHDISASLSVEISHITGLSAKLKRLSLRERRGTNLESLQGLCEMAGEGIYVKDVRMKMSHPIDEVSQGFLEGNGSCRMIGDSVSIDLKRFNIKSDGWGDILGSATLNGRISQPDFLHLAADFLPSFFGRETLEKVKKDLRLPLPVNITDLLSYVETVNWQGHAEISTFKKMSFSGKLGTHGKLESAFDSDLHWDDGNYDESTLDGFFRLKTPTCSLNGKANTELSRSHIDLKYDAKVHRADFYQMQLTHLKNFQHLEFSGTTEGDVRIPTSLFRKHEKEYSRYDLSKVPIGTVRIDSLCIKGPQDTVFFDPIFAKIVPESGSMVGILNSPVLNMVVTPTAALGLMPENHRLAKLFSIPIELAEGATFVAEWDSVSDHLQAELNAPKLVSNDNQMTLHLTAEGNTQEDLPIPEMLRTKLMFECKTPKHYLATRMNSKVDWNPLTLELEPSSLNIDNREYTFSEASIIQTHKGRFVLDNLQIQDRDQKFALSGEISDNGPLYLIADFEHFKTDFLFDMLQKGYLNFGGYATGTVNISSDSVFHLATQDLYFDQFSYIDDVLGNCSFSCFYDFENSRIDLDADIFSDEAHTSHTSGWVQMGKRDSLDLLFQTDSLNIDFLDYWLGGILQDMHGQATGDIHLFGDCDSLSLTGHPILNNVNFTYNLLGGRFTLNDTLHMIHGENLSDGYIGLNNAKIYDANGQLAYLSLDLNHKHLHNMEYGVDIDIPENQDGFLIFDHPKQEYNEIYWGRLWATGRCQMHGTYSHHRISAQMSTAGKSVFNLSPGEESFSDNSYNFLAFRDKQVMLETEEADRAYTRTRTNQNINKSEPFFVEADLLIHANERCLVYVQMDPLAEDRLTCRGNGDLSLHYDPYHDITLTGSYDISQGSYTVNMRGDLMTKAFQLQDGSRVTFTGLPSEAGLNLDAVYSIPSANLRDLDESFASLASLSRTSLPVDCKLKVTGLITAPQIAFDLEVKNASDDVQALVHNIIGTQEMLNREVFYLLLFSKFYTPEYASTSQRQTGSELTSFASSSLTSQLNNLLGHMSDNFTLGTNFRSDKGDFSDMEMDFSVSTRLLNDRLLLNGNLGYRDPANRIGMNNTNTSFIGDFDVEFLINTSGTVRAKAYSHYNERDYSINNALTTQGIGIILRKDFQNLKDLLKRQH